MPLAIFLLELFFSLCFVYLGAARSAAAGDAYIDTATFSRAILPALKAARWIFEHAKVDLIRNKIINNDTLFFRSVCATKQLPISDASKPRGFCSVRDTSIVHQLNAPVVPRCLRGSDDRTADAPRRRRLQYH